MSPVYVGLLAGVIVFGVIAIFVLIRGGSSAARERQLSIITGRGALRNDVNDRETKDKRRADLTKKLKDSQADEKKKRESKRATVRDMLIYAGLTVPISRFWLASALSAALFFMLAFLMKLMPIAQICLAIVGFFGFPRFVLKWMAARRQRKFLEEFADALEAMVRLLKAGMPVGEAVSMISREFQGPVGEEMSRVYESQRIGVPLGEAVLQSAKRMPLPEVQMFATGIIIQQQTGASLSDVLMSLAALIRARFRLKRKVQALSAEAKASAGIIGALPVVVSVGLYFINPEYIELLFITPKGKIMLSFAIGWMMMGVLMMRQMINFKV